MFGCPNLTPEEKQCIINLHNLGLVGAEIARRIGRSDTAVYNCLGPTGAPNWTEQKKERVIKMYAKGQTPKQIARHMRRSETAVKIFMCRHRKDVRNNPAKQQALRLLTFALKYTSDPGRAIVAIRKSRLYGGNDDVLQF